MKVKLMIIGLFVLGFTFSSQAQTRAKTPQITKTQVKLDKKIQHDVKSGKLTKKEAIKLQRQKRSITKAKRRAKADGVVTPKEKRNLRARQNRACAKVCKAKHNNKARQ